MVEVNIPSPWNIPENPHDLQRSFKTSAKRHCDPMMPLLETLPEALQWLFRVVKTSDVIIESLADPRCFDWILCLRVKPTKVRLCDVPTAGGFRFSRLARVSGVPDLAPQAEQAALNEAVNTAAAIGRALGRLHR